MRIVFLTPEFVLDYPTGGGLATFVSRVAKALNTAGHDVRIITLSNAVTDGTEVEWEGITVTQLNYRTDTSDLWNRFVARIWGRISTRELLTTLHAARRLATECERQHSLKPFDVIHGSDYGLTTYFLNCPGATVISRCSSHSTHLRWFAEDWPTLSCVVFPWLERATLRKSRLVYAPSKYVADYLSNHGIMAQVIRPPFGFTPQLDLLARSVATDRYLLHAGNINIIKGSDLLARALLLAWRSEPELKMIWVGTVSDKFKMKLQRLWEQKSKNVVWLRPVSRANLQSLISESIAVVAPSRTDNLPNVVLESQAIGTPVIGTFGASIDEIVVDGVSGRLFMANAQNDLAALLVEAWRGCKPFDKRVPIPPIFAEMTPHIATQKLVHCIERLGC